MLRHLSRLYPSWEKHIQSLSLHPRCTQRQPTTTIPRQHRRGDHAAAAPLPNRKAERKLKISGFKPPTTTTMSSSTPAPVAIPPTFLTGPAPSTATTSRINFATTPVPQYANCWAAVIDDALTPAECATLLRMAHAAGGGAWERAMINVGGGRQAMATDTRNCGRIIHDSRELVDRLWARVAPLVPELDVLEGERWCLPQPRYWTAREREEGLGSVLHDRQVEREERWRCVGLNERLRFLRYEGGEYFRPHQDGVYETPDKSQRSFFTLHLYLNDGEEVRGEKDRDRRSPFIGEIEGEPDEPLRGGATTFHGPEDLWTLSFGEPDPSVSRRRVDIVPRVGRVLLFQHRHMIHSGDDVVAGVKYTMRTDVMYTKEAKEE